MDAISSHSSSSVLSHVTVVRFRNEKVSMYRVIKCVFSEKDIGMVILLV